MCIGCYAHRCLFIVSDLQAPGCADIPCRHSLSNKVWLQAFLFLHKCENCSPLQMQHATCFPYHILHHTAHKVATMAAGRRQSLGKSASIATRPAMQVRTAPSNWQLRKGMPAKMPRSVGLKMLRTRPSQSPAQSLRPQGTSLQAPVGHCLPGPTPTALKYRQAPSAVVTCLA